MKKVFIVSIVSENIDYQKGESTSYKYTVGVASSEEEVEKIKAMNSFPPPSLMGLPFTPPDFEVEEAVFFGSL